MHYDTDCKVKAIDFVFFTLVGPMMILEYCETGTLKDYLRARKERVDENVMEKLFRFSFDICKGMEHLASKKASIMQYFGSLKRQSLT